MYANSECSVGVWMCMDLSEPLLLTDAISTKISCAGPYILKAKSNFTLLLYIPFLGIGEWYFK